MTETSNVISFADAKRRRHFGLLPKRKTKTIWEENKEKTRKESNERAIRDYKLK